MITRDDPATVAEALAGADPSDVGPMTAASAVSLALGPGPNGWFAQFWQIASPNKYDWIGLYPSDATPDSGYVSGNNWEWAVNGESMANGEKRYVTSTPVQKAGYQARYLTWNADAGVYQSILRTPEFDGEVCA